MGFILRPNRAFILILTSALLWASIAWAAPSSRLDEEAEPTAAEELPTIEYDPLTYARSAHGGILLELLDVAAAGETWTCDKCGAENPARAKYCSECGTKRGEAAALGLTDARVCPKCGFVNEKGASFCGGCRYNFYGAGGTASGLEMVYVPGRGNVPKGTMIEPGHAQTALWVTGLVMWLALGPGVAVVGTGQNRLEFYIAGGLISLGGLVMFIVGLAVKTEPVYALRADLGADVQPRLACARKSLEPERFAVEAEVTLISF